MAELSLLLLLLLGVSELASYFLRHDNPVARCGVVALDVCACSRRVTLPCFRTF